MFARFIQLNFKYLTSFFLITTVLYNFNLLRCDAETQQGRDLCDLYRACFGNDVAHFLFV